MTEMAILQDVDKCMRCNGCVVSCKRTWKMKALNPGIHKTAPDQRVIIKSQKRVDMGPFMRYSCWHCTNPPCIKRCPFSAMEKKPNGAVAIDPSKCQPDQTNPANGKTCVRQCQTDCGRGGYPKIGAGSDLFSDSQPKSWKCTLCYGRAGADADLDPAYGFALPTRIYPDPSGNYNSPLNGASVPDMKHQPSCVFTCPAKAMHWDAKATIVGYLNNTANGFVSAQGDGSVYWASRKGILIAPKADPLIEDHVTPLVSSVLSGPFAKAALVPTLLVGGLVAVVARRQRLANQTTEEV
jgi:Fe-S-cluster-containing dehydrogenase component